MSRPKVDPKDVELLTAEELDAIASYGKEATNYSITMLVAVLIAAVVAVLGYVFDARKIVDIAVACFIGFLIVGTIGTEVKFRRFLRLTAEAVNRHKNETTP